jgi:serine/threonine protein kinase
MKPDKTDRELLRLAQELDDGRLVDWTGRDSSDPALAAGIRGLRDLEVLAEALGRDPERSGPDAPGRAWLEPGSILGRYPVECEAGRGGMGVVYLARDPVLDRPVALKLLPPDVARTPERLTRFTGEAKLLASLNHPNVATIHGLEESAGHRFLVLEWVPGETLEARLRRGPLPWREALEVCGQIARALAAAHEGGVIHRDLKPGNVMITPQGRIKVLDFGLARRGDAHRDLLAGPSDPRIQGTWGYVSPECLTREEDHRADVFAFGCVFYECLAGVPAFPGDSVDEIRLALLQREPDQARLPAATPPAIRRLIASCVVKDPERRLGSIAEAVRTIELADGRRLPRPPRLSNAAIAVPHRLPEEADAFVGRENELGELAETLRRGARLVTLRGAGGLGKTRLAVRLVL